MSKYFAESIFLTVLFISFNSICMHDYKPNRSHAIIPDAKKKKERYQDKFFISPSSFDFKYESIALNKNDLMHRIIFKKHQEPLITNYLLEGKRVGSLIQVGDEISFKSKGPASSLSFQIPYKVGSLTINTKGQCVFQNKIDVCAAYIGARTVNLEGKFYSNTDLIIEAQSCKAHDQISCSDFFFNGNHCAIVSNGIFDIHNSLTIIARFLLNEGFIRCNNKSLLKSLLLRNLGAINSAILRFKGNAVVNQGTITSKDTFYCASKLFEHYGIIDVFNFSTKKGDRFSSTPLSVLHVQGDWKSLYTSLDLQGSFCVNNIDIVGKDFSSKLPFHCIAENMRLKLEEDVSNEGVIKVLGLLDIDSKSIRLSKTSSLIVENAGLKVDKAINNEGVVSVKNHLSIDAHSVSNAGKIETKSVIIKADRYYYNKIFSILSAKNNLTINTPLSINWFSLMNAQALTINSALELNALGINLAKNKTTNSLFSVNAGLLIPKFSSFSEICSLPSLWGFGESLFIKYIPICGTIYAALKNTQGLYHQTRTFLSEATSLYKQKNIRMSDRIAMICLIKSLFNAARQTSNLVQQNYSLLSRTSQPENDSGPAVLPDAISKAIRVAKEIASSLMSHCAPDSTTSSMIDLNCGIAMGINSNTNNIYNRNAGTSLYINNSIDTRYGDNIGNLYAYSLLINAISSYCSEGKIGISSGMIKAYDLSLYDRVYAHKDIALEVENSADIKSDIKARNIGIKSGYWLRIHGSLDSVCTDLESKYIMQDGTITGQTSCYGWS